jgi:hypothetical protein
MPAHFAEHCSRVVTKSFVITMSNTHDCSIGNCHNNNRTERKSYNNNSMRKQMVTWAISRQMPQCWHEHFPWLPKSEDKPCSQCWELGLPCSLSSWRILRTVHSEQPASSTISLVLFPSLFFHMTIRSCICFSIQGPWGAIRGGRWWAGMVELAVPELCLCHITPTNKIDSGNYLGKRLYIRSASETNK